MGVGDIGIFTSSHRLSGELLRKLKLKWSQTTSVVVKMRIYFQIYAKTMKVENVIDLRFCDLRVFFLSFEKTNLK